MVTRMLRAGVLASALLLGESTVGLAATPDSYDSLPTDNPIATIASYDAPPATDATDPVPVAASASVVPETSLPAWGVNDVDQLWSARLGAIFLQRGRASSTPFLYNVNTGDSIVDPHDFVFPFLAGADVGLIRRGQWADFDFRFFGINQASDTIGPFLEPPGTALALPGNNNGGGSIDPLIITSTYVTSLNSAEANLRRNVSSNVSLLAGFRYINFRDRLSAAATDTVSGEQQGASIGAANNLYGFQIGADAILWAPTNRFWVEGAVKAGVYGNAASVDLTFGDPDNGNGFRGQTSHDHTAFVGDLNFTGVYQINDRWALRSGYQLLWLSGVAVAPEQLHSIDFNAGQPTTNTSHAAFFHGATVGIERSW